MTRSRLCFLFLFSVFHFNDSIPFHSPNICLSKAIDKKFQVFVLIKAVPLIFRRPNIMFVFLYFASLLPWYKNVPHSLPPPRKPKIVYSHTFYRNLSLFFLFWGESMYPLKEERLLVHNLNKIRVAMCL